MATLAYIALQELFLNNQPHFNSGGIVMPDRRSEIVVRTAYALPLLGFGLGTFIEGGLWWGAFLCVLTVAILGEVIYQHIHCKFKRRGCAVHCFILGISAVLGFSVMYLLRDSKQGTALIFLGAIMVIFFDTFSLIAGWLQPKQWHRQIAPKESPKKTWGGFIGGTLLSLIAGAVTLDQLERHYAEVDISKPLMYLLLLLTPIVAYFGDLNESMAKRRLLRQIDTFVPPSPFHVKPLKDFSSILGPHGGVSDRFDAMTAVFASIGLVWLVLI